MQTEAYWQEYHAETDALVQRIVTAMSDLGYRHYPTCTDRENGFLLFCHPVEPCQFTPAAADAAQFALWSQGLVVGCQPSMANSYIVVSWTL